MVACFLVKRKLQLLVALTVTSLTVLAAAGSDSLKPRQAEFAWRFATGGQIRSRPAVAADGTVYAIAEDSFLYAISPGGGLAWKCDLGWLPADCLSVSPDGMIYVGLTNKDFLAVNPNGVPAWREHVDALFIGDPLIAPDGTVYVGIAPGTLLSMSESGRLQWSITLPATLLSAPVMDGAGTIYLIASDRRLYALTQWGEFKWSLPLGAVAVTPAIAADGTVLVGTTDGQVIAVTPDGDVRWKSAVGAPVAGVSVGPDEIVAATADGLLAGFSADGKELWKERTGARLDSSPLMRGASFLCFARDGTLFMVRMPVRIVERLSVGTSGAAVVARDGSVYLGGRDWVLYAFPRPAGQVRVTGPWPQAGHDEQHTGRTPYGPEGGVEAALRQNPDYLYLESLADSASREQARQFLSEVNIRIDRQSLGKSTWYVVRLLEKLAGTGLIDVDYRNQKVINDFPDLRADAAAALGEIGSAGSRWTLIHVVQAEQDPYALSMEIIALGRLGFDGDGSSVRAITSAFSRTGASPPDYRLASATVEALDRITASSGSLSQRAAETLFNISHGPYPAQIRSAALDALGKGSVQSP